MTSASPLLWPLFMSDVESADFRPSTPACGRPLCGEKRGVLPSPLLPLLVLGRPRVHRVCKSFACSPLPEPCRLQIVCTATHLRSSLFCLTVPAVRMVHPQDGRIRRRFRSPRRCSRDAGRPITRAPIRPGAIESGPFPLSEWQRGGVIHRPQQWRRCTRPRTVAAPDRTVMVAAHSRWGRRPSLMRIQRGRLSRHAPSRQVCG